MKPGYHEWDLIDFDKGDDDEAEQCATYRMPVPGGWLYRTVDYVRARGEGVTQLATAIVFVPEPERD